jgi:phosphatidylserine/phosphatidylglycerophosphate/cardiolipin synthase-like enzyme
VSIAAGARPALCRRVLLLLLGAAVLSACAIDPLRARRAGATAAAAQERATACAAADACAAPSPLRDLAARAFAESRADAPVHYVDLLERGAESLALRIHLIRSAERSIELQTFIFAEDDAGLLLLDELVAAARRGVRVRVIVDQLFSLDDPRLYAALARAHANFELRVYNPTFHKASTPPLEFAAGVLCCWLRFNQRMHNKLLLVDDALGIAGGRNYEDRYYDWDHAFDYRDRDVLVAGPAATAMRDSFDRFWTHRRTAALSVLRDVAARILADGVNAPAYAAHAYRDPARVAALLRDAGDAGYIRAHFVVPAFRVGRVDYFSDDPGKSPHSRERDDAPSRRIMALVRGARERLVLQTPYLVLSSTARDVFRQLRRDSPSLRIVVSTNSLAATDAFYVYALSHKYKKRYLKLGFEIHEFKPFPAEAGELVAGYARLDGGAAADAARFERTGRAPLVRAGVRIGLHAKSLVVDDAVAIIGSHNFDPRSDDHNTESGVIVYDRAVAAALAAQILRDSAPENAWIVARRPRGSLLSRLNSALADFSAALPLFDFWPFRYATSFELRPGCVPSAPDDPQFYACHDNVGDFPEVGLPLKTIYTRIVTAFGAGLLSIM